MSNHLTSLAYKLDLGSLLRKSVMVLLADKASDDGSGIWASKQTFADELCCSKQAVINTVQAFIAEGLLSETGHRKSATGFTVEYSLCVSAMQALPRVKRHAEGSTPLTGQPGLPVNHVEGRGQPGLPKPPLTPQSEAKASSKGFALPSDIPAEPWAGFEEMRRDIKHPLNARSRKLAVTELRRLRDEEGWPPGEVLNHVTLNRYRGIYPPKGRKHGTPQHRPSQNAIARDILARLDFTSDHEAGYR